jgi:hypothetical protein
MVKTPALGKLASLRYHSLFMYLVPILWISLKASRSATATSFGDNRTIGPYFLWSESM